ncbi:hypothetical protein [Streptomyces sp. NPDC050388]|uniref:hypothetical protein n=1 Tax=Streptomyces sp. NPDC050388 TaxID=3155781 RepID=UPI00343688D4
MTTEETRIWAARWLGDREVPPEFLRMSAIQAAREKHDTELKDIESARPAELDGAGCADPLEYLGVTIIGPGNWKPDAPHQAYSYFDEERNADYPAMRGVLSHILPVAGVDWGLDLVYGYWLYPGEAWPPPVVLLDSEGSMEPDSRTLTDTLMSYAFKNFEEEAPLIGQWLTRIGIPVSARSAADIPTPVIAKEPDALYMELDT